jgi:hypothetical protein
VGTARVCHRERRRGLLQQRLGRGQVAVAGGGELLPERDRLTVLVEHHRDLEIGARARDAGGE